MIALSRRTIVALTTIAEAIIPARQRISPEQLRAWEALIQAQKTLARQLGADLEERHGVSLGDYEVMLNLSRAPNRELRMADLARAVSLSRSGLTRQVDRLVKAGWVARRACPTDARGTFAYLTPEGMSVFRRAAVTHMRGIAEHFTTHFDDGEAGRLADALEKVAR